MSTLLTRGHWQIGIRDFYEYCVSEATDSFPENIVPAGTIDKTGAIRYRRLLETRSQTQFAEEPKEGLSVWWYDRHDQEWNFCKSLHDWDGLRGFLGIPKDLTSVPSDAIPDIPESTFAPTQFFFMRSVDSLSGLDVSKKMILLLLTWLQVLPQFLDFLLVFSMGWTKLENEMSGLWYHLPGFSLPYHSHLHRALRIPQLHRSKFELQLAYLLMAPETHPMDEMGYRIRPAVIYHSLDWAFRQSKWIVVATNYKLRRLLMTNSQDRRQQHTTVDWFIGCHLDHQLDYHLMLCEWASGSWRWYVNRLNQKLTFINSGGSSASASQFVDHIGPVDNSPAGTSTWYGYPIEKFTHQEHSIPLEVSNTPRSHNPNYTWFNRPELQRAELTTHAASHPLADSLSPLSDDQISEKQIAASDTPDLALQDLKTRAIEIRECLTSNMDTMNEMVKVFTKLVESKEFPKWEDKGVDAPVFPSNYVEAKFERSTPEQKEKKMQSEKQHCVDAVTAFASEVGKHISRQQQMQNKVDALLASIELSENAARHSEITRILKAHSHALTSPLTVQLTMKQLAAIQNPALQSSKDGIAVRTITYVALIFVPGAFISAFFSAGIIKWPDGAASISDEDLTPGALKLWLALTIPITVGAILISMIFKYQARPRFAKRDIENQRESHSDTKRLE